LREDFVAQGLPLISVEISNDQMDELDITKAKSLPRWNYTLRTA